MAYIVEDDKLNGQNQGSGEQTTGASTAPMLGGGSSAVGNNVSTAGVGAGGSGWTNIQAYLNANKDNNNTASAINNHVGSTFDAEESKLSEAQTGYQKQLNDGQKNYSDDDLDNFVNQGAQGDSNAATSVKSYLGSQYQQAPHFNWALGSGAQDFGSQLKQNAPDGLLNSVYNKAAGGQMASGQAALQRQLDRNNPNVNSAIDQMKGRYSALENLSSNAYTSAQNSYNQAQQQYAQGQTRAKDYYGNKLSQLDSDYQAALGSPKVDANQIAKQYNTVADYLGSTNRLGITEDAPVSKEDAIKQATQPTGKLYT